MRPINVEFLNELIDFAPSGKDRDRAFGQLQRDGTVAVFNMLARNGCAYLADEVGMGKTYVALGVMSLLRYFDPHARIVVIAPRENIQRKWVKELHNFVNHNWKMLGNRVKSLHGGPVWEPVVCSSLVEFAREALVNQDRDFFLRMTSFSVRLSDPDDRNKTRAALVNNVPWLYQRHVPNKDREGFRDAFAVALNGAVPEADLVIFDEAHNLKHGFRSDGSTRNRVMGLAFGHPEGRSLRRDWYAPKAKRVLLLSATPFEDDYGAIQRQLSIFGFGDTKLRGPTGEDTLDISDLANPEIADDQKLEIAQRLLIRRVSGLRIGGKLHTKNMYRREWRRGGLEQHDQPIEIDDPKQRLVIALMQKKVSEILQTDRFNNHFQIGMLSSFESLSQSIGNVHRRTEDKPAFDGEEQRRSLKSEKEKNGIDTEAIGEIVRSYQKTFGLTLPHPKLDTTTDALSRAFESGEKSLVFVRRVRTVDELAAKLEERFDYWIRKRMESELPNLRQEVAELFNRYAIERSRRSDEHTMETNKECELSIGHERIDRREDLEEEDEGGAENFFTWFFRGIGPADVLSGAAFQKNRLASISSVYATLFEEDYVASLLNTDSQNALEELARVTAIPIKKCSDRLREYAFGFLQKRSRRSDGYPRLYVFEGYQVAGLVLLLERGGEIGKKAEIILDERFQSWRPLALDPPLGFPSPAVGIGLTTIFTELRRHVDLQNHMLPQESLKFRVLFRRQEQRRALYSAIARLGATYIDLYLLAMSQIGSFTLGQRQETFTSADLARNFVSLLNRQKGTPGFHAYYELTQAADAFDHILAVNFPEAHSCPIPKLARLFGNTLQQQTPVGRMFGGVNQRMVRQFRMPGFPLILITTDVLQEGEDLHTFCRQVVHYGIAWTPSDLEQRTGRVDRIGGLVQRCLDGTSELPREDDLIQVFFPHLQDTVELLQVRRVLRRLNRFLRLIHRGDGSSNTESQAIDANRAWHEEFHDVRPLRGPLESAFPINPQWLVGELGKKDVSPFNWEQQYRHFESIWQRLCERHPIVEHVSNTRHVRCGEFDIKRSGTPQLFNLSLRSQIAGAGTLLECKSAIGEVDLENDSVVDALMTVLDDCFGVVKLCVDPRIRKHADQLYISREILFDTSSTRIADASFLFENTLKAASHLRAVLTELDLFGESCV